MGMKIEDLTVKINYPGASTQAPVSYTHLIEKAFDKVKAEENPAQMLGEVGSAD